MFHRMHLSIFLSTDPMYPYLNTAHMVPICGLSDGPFIGCAVTMGRTLYVTDYFDYSMKVFKYDLDDRDLRHENPQKRKIKCSNKRRLVFSGVLGDLELIIPCPHTHTLYIVEEDPYQNGDAMVHRVKPNGMIVSRWLLLDLPWYAIYSMALNSFGSYLVVTTRDNQVKVSETVNEHLGYTEEITDENSLNNKIFVCAAFQDDTIDSIVTVTSQEADYHGENLASDDHQCLLMMTNSNFTLFDKSTSSCRDIAIKNSPPKEVSVDAPLVRQRFRAGVQKLSTKVTAASFLRHSLAR